MIAYITSVGEPTTDLCIWSLKRNGFDVYIMNNKSSLASKLHDIYQDADNDFVRVDADVIPNRNLTEKLLKSSANSHQWWIQFQTFGWYSQDFIWGGVQYIKKEALPALRENVDRFLDIDRPETQLSRIKEFYQPRRFDSCPMICGIHGYGIRDYKHVIKQKANRGQSANYDFEMVDRLNQL